MNIEVHFWLVVVFAIYGNAELSVDDAIAMYIEDAIATVKLRIHKAAQRHEGQRHKRSIQLGYLNRSDIPGYGLDIESIIPVYSIPTSHAVQIKPFKIGNAQYLAVANYQNQNGDYRTISKIYKFINGNFTLIQEFPTSGCIDFHYAKLLMEDYIIFVENVGTNWLGRTSYSQSFKVYKHVIPSRADEREFEYQSSIGMFGGTSVKSFVHENKNYFVAANSYSSDGNKHNTKSILYLKTQFGFLMTQQFETQGAQDAEIFTIDGLLYIAFANYKDNEERVDIYSTIYREKRPLGADGIIQFEYAQRILTHGAKDFEYFYFKNNHYLAVANQRSQLITYNTNSKEKNFTVTDDYEVDSVIYWWSGTFFVEWQRIPTNGAVKWSTFNGPNGGMMLVVANSKTDAVIFTYDAIRGLFKPTQVQGLRPSSSSSTVPDVRSVQHFIIDNETYLAVANFKQNAGYNIFKLNFAYSPITDVQPSLYETIKKSLNEVRNHLSKLKERLMKTKELLNDVMTVDTNQTIYGTLKFSKANFEKLKVKNLIYTNSSKNNPIEKAVHQAMMLNKNLTENEKRIKELQERFDDAVTKNSPQNITGKKIFRKSVSFTNVSIKEMNVGLINGINISDLNEKALSKTKDQNITARYVFNDDLTMLSNLTVLGTVNGLRIPDDVMTTNTNQTVTGKKIFMENVTIFGNITTENTTINGMKIPEDIVLRSSNQRISGFKTFRSKVKFRKSVNVDGNVNGRNLTEFSENVVTLSTDQVITGKKTFANGFKIDSDVRVSGLIDGVNLTHLYEDAVRQNANETIQGTKRFFGSVHVNGDIETLSTTNGIRLQDDVMTTNTDQLIRSKKVFHNVIVEGDIITNSTINGLDFSKDIVTKNTDQIISGKKIFKNKIFLNADMIVNGTIDGVDIAELNRTSVKINQPNNITGKKIFLGKVIVKDQITIENMINNISLSDLRKNVFTKSSNGTVTAPITFENVEVFGNVNMKGKMNGIKIPDDLIPLNKDANVTCNITFMDDISFERNLDFAKDGKLNGKNLRSFASSVMLDGVDQDIYGLTIFKNNISIENDVIVEGKINNARIPDDFVTLNTPQNISGVKTFHNRVVVNGELFANTINVSTTINGVYISDLLRDAVYIDQNQTIYGNLTILGNITSAGDIKVGKLVNGVNITHLANNIVRISKPQNITGLKIFTNDVQFMEPIMSPGKINGVNLTELDLNSLKKSGDQVITGTKVFAGNVIMERNLHSKTINGINLQELKNKVLMKSGDQEILGSLTLLNNATFDIITVNGTINGIHTDDLMLTFGNQTISGKKVFIDSLKFEKDLYVGGTLNDVNLTELDKNIMKINEDQNVSALLIFESGFHVEGNIEIEGKVNDVDISELNLTAVHFGDTKAITGTKIFKNNVTIKGNANFEKGINGINLTDVLSDAMLKSEEQVICADKIFTSSDGMKIKSTLTATNLKVSGFINGVNITELDTNSVKIHGDQTLYGEYIFLNNVTFKKDLITNGLVNGINISRDVMMTKGDQIITGYKEFEHLIANENINVTGKVDGVDLSEFAKERVTLSTDQNITGGKIFKSPVTIEGNFDLADKVTVNDIDISEDLILTNKPSLITGKKIFKQSITIKNDLNISGTINGIDLNELEKNIVLLNSNKTLRGINIFNKNLYVHGNVVVEGYINGKKIETLYNETRELKKTTMEELNKLNSTLLTNCKAIKIMMDAAGAEFYLTSVEKIGHFSKQQLGQIHSINIGNRVFLSIARLIGSPSACGPAYILQCTPSLSCVTSQIITTRAVNLHFYEVADDFYLFVGHWGQNTSECQSYPEILKYNKNNGKFMPFYSIKTSILSSIKDIKVVTANIIALIPSPLLTSSLFTSPVASLGSILTRNAAMTRTFRYNSTTYLVTASVLIDILYVEIFMLNTTTLEATKLQQIPTKEVSSIDVGKVDHRIMLACAEGRHGTWQDVKVYIFAPERNKFYFYQRVPISATSIRYSTVHTRHYLIFASPENGFGLCPWRGVMGFQKCISVPDVGIRYIHTVVTNDGVFAIGTTDSQMVSYKAFFDGLVPKFNGTLNC